MSAPKATTTTQPPSSTAAPATASGVAIQRSSPSITSTAIMMMTMARAEKQMPEVNVDLAGVSNVADMRTHQHHQNHGPTQQQEH